MKRLFVYALCLMMTALCFTENNAKAEDAQYRNSGLINSFEAGYKYPIAAETKLVYENLGVRKVNATNPLEFTYSIGYKFNNWVALSVGSGISYETVDIRGYGDKLISEYEGPGKYSNMDIPVFLDLDVYMTKTKVQPFFSFRGGMYVLNSSALMLEGGLGCNMRLGRRCNLYVLATASLYPALWGTMGEELTMGRRNVLAPGVKIGFSL